MALETVSTVAPYITATEPNAAGSPIYFGRAFPGSTKDRPVWQIRKFTYDGSGNLTDITFANGSLDFASIWNDRASLTYA